MTERDICAAAHERNDPAARAAFLDSACAGDPALRKRVDQLLAESAGEGVTRTLAHAPGDPAFDETKAPEEAESDFDLKGLLAPPQEVGSIGRLDHYEVLGILGQGGMGVVLKAHDTKLRRVEAIKLLAPALAAVGTARRRFAREAQSAAAVRDEHVVKIHAVCEDAAVPYIVMEFVSGITLEDRIRAVGPLPVREIVRIGMQSARGLAAAHAQGLVHRDVKPGNILLEDGLQRVKLTDFGLARAADDASISRSGVIAGTPMYMSPEQAKGDQIDHRSDLFSLGSVLYTLCTGRPAFRAESTVAVLTRVCDDTPRPIREVNPDVPKWVCAVVDKLMMKEPAERIQSSAEVADLLARYLAHLEAPDRVAPPPAVRGVKAGVRRRLIRPAFAAMAAVAIVAFLLLGYRMLRPADDSANGLPSGISPLPGWKPPTAQELAARPSPLDGRKWEPPAAWLPETAEIVAVFGDRQGEVWAVAPSPDGRAIASGGADGSIILWDLAGWKVGEPQPPGRRLGAHTATVFSLAFTRDGKLLASGGKDGTIRLWDAASGTAVRTLQAETSKNTTDVAFSADGKLVAAGDEDGSVRLWDVESGEERSPLRWHTQHASSVAFSPDNRFLASVGAQDRKVILTDLQTLQRTETLGPPGEGRGEAKAAFGCDGRTLAFGGWDDTVRLWDLDEKKETTLSGTGPNLTGLAVHPSGRFVAAAREGAVRFWDRTLPRQSLLVGPGLFGAAARQIAFTPEGRYLIVAGGNGLVTILRTPAATPYEFGPPIKLPTSEELAARPSVLDMSKQDSLTPDLAAVIGRARFQLPRSGDNSWMAHDREGKYFAVPNGDGLAIFDAKSGELIRTLQGSGRMYTTAFSADSKLVAGGSWGGAADFIRVWDVKTGELVQAFPTRGEQVWSVALSPNGKRLLSSTNKGLTVWDLSTGNAFRTFAGDRIWLTGVSPDGKRVAYRDPDLKTRVVNPETGEELGVLDSMPDATAFSPDGKTLAVGNDRELSLWDVEKRELLKKLDTPAGWLAFVSDGKTLLTAKHDQNGEDRNHVVTRWDLKTYEGKPLPSLSNIASWTGFDLSPDGKTLFSLCTGDGKDTCVRAYDAETGKPLFSEESHRGPVRAVAASPDGTYLASAGQDGTIRIWNLKTRRPIHVISRPGQADTVAFSPDSKTLAAHWDKEAPILFNTDTGTEVRKFGDGEYRVSSFDKGGAYSPDGRWLAAGGEDGLVRVWDVSTGRLRRAFRMGSGFTISPTFSPNGKLLAAGSESGSITAWDLESGWQVGSLPRQPGAVMWLGFDPDARSLAVGGHWRGDFLNAESPLFEFTPESGKAEKHPSKTHTYSLEAGIEYRITLKALDEKLTPLLIVDELGDGTRIRSASGANAEIKLRPTKASTCKVIACSQTEPGWFQLIVHKTRGTALIDSDWLGVGYAPIFDVATGKEMHRVAGHNSGITAGAWRADGRVLATSGNDGILFHIPGRDSSWKLLRVSSSPELAGMAPTPDGRYLTVTSANGEIPIYRIPNPPPPYDPGAARPVPDAKELAARSAAADALKRENIPTELLRLVGGGDPSNVPPEVVAVLGDVRFTLPRMGKSSWMSSDSDGKFLAIPTAGTVSVFDARTGGLLQAFTDLADRVYCTAFSPDGKFLAAGNWPGEKKSSTVKLWSLATGKEALSLETGIGNVHEIYFTKDGKRLFAFGDKGAQTWDRTGKLLRTIPRQTVSHTLYKNALSSDGKRMVMADTMRSVKVWDLEAENPTTTLEGHTSQPFQSAFSPDGKWLATGSENEMMLWNAEKMELVKTIKTPASYLQFAPDGKTILTAQHFLERDLWNQVVTRWDLATFEGKPLPPFTDRRGWPVYHLSPDSKTLYSILVDGRDQERHIRQYDSTTGKELFPQLKYQEQYLSVAFSPDGKTLAAVGAQPGIQIWNVATGKLERTLPNEKRCFEVCFSAGGKWIAAGEASGTVALYETATGAKPIRLPATPSDVRAVAFSPDGRFVAGTTFTGVVNLWDVATGRLLKSLAGRRKDAWSLAFSPDSKTLATGWTDSEVLLFDVATGWVVSELRVAKVRDVRWLGFHPDGRSLGVVGLSADEALSVWDLATGKQLRQTTAAGSDLCGAWRADGRLLVSSSDVDGTIRLVSTDDKPVSHKIIQLYPSSSPWVHSVSLSPEGRHLATANPDGTISILRLAEPGVVFRP